MERLGRLAGLSPEEARRHVAAISKDTQVVAIGPIKTPAAWAQAREAIRAAVIAAAKTGHTITYEAKLPARQTTERCQHRNHLRDTVNDPPVDYGDVDIEGEGLVFCVSARNRRGIYPAGTIMRSSPRG